MGRFCIRKVLVAHLNSAIMALIGILPTACSEEAPPQPFVASISSPEDRPTQPVGDEPTFLSDLGEGEVDSNRVQPISAGEALDRLVPSIGDLEAAYEQSRKAFHARWWIDDEGGMFRANLDSLLLKVLLSSDDMLGLDFAAARSEAALKQSDAWMKVSVGKASLLTDVGREALYRHRPINRVLQHAGMLVEIGKASDIDEGLELFKKGERATGRYSMGTRANAQMEAAKASLREESLLHALDVYSELTASRVGDLDLETIRDQVFHDLFGVRFPSPLYSVRIETSDHSGEWDDLDRMRSDISFEEAALLIEDSAVDFVARVVDRLDAEGYCSPLLSQAVVSFGNSCSNCHHEEHWGARIPCVPDWSASLSDEGFLERITLGVIPENKMNPDCWQAISSGIDQSRIPELSGMLALHRRRVCVALFAAELRDARTLDH